MNEWSRIVKIAGMITAIGAAIAMAAAGFQVLSAYTYSVFDTRYAVKEIEHYAAVSYLEILYQKRDRLLSLLATQRHMPRHEIERWKRELADVEREIRIIEQKRSGGK